MSHGSMSMPPSVAEIFLPLQAELVRLHERWALFRTLFGKDEDRIGLLNSYSAIVFGCAQWAMYLDVILALCRLTDPAESSKKIGHRPNLTLERLLNVVTADDAGFGSGLATNEWAAVTNYRDNHFEEIRSKRIAHNDLTKMTARFNGYPIGWPSREQVEQFLTLCTSLMEKVYEKYIGCPFAFDFNDGERAGESFIKVLEEFSKRHIDDVKAGRARLMIKPPKGWPNLSPRLERTTR